MLHAQVTEYDVVRFLELLIDVSGKLDRYAPGSKIIAESGHQLVETLNRLRSKPEDDFVIGELYNEIQINDVSLSQAAQVHPVVEAFVYFLLERNLRSLRLSPTVRAEQMIRFLETANDVAHARATDAELHKLSTTAIRLEPQVPVTEYTPDDRRVQFVRVDASPADMPEPTDVSWEDFEDPNAETPKVVAQKTGEGERFLGVRVVVGHHPLYGATVQVTENPHPIVVFSESSDAELRLKPGEYTLEVRYEDYRVLHRLKVDEGSSSVVTIDLQKVFEY